MKSYFENDLGNCAMNLNQCAELACGINKMPTKSPVDIDTIVRTVANYYKMFETELTENTRKRDVVNPRQIAMYFALKYSNKSLGNIGKEIGNKDHATVLHAYKMVGNLIFAEKGYISQLNDIKNRLKPFDGQIINKTNWDFKNKFTKFA